MDFFQCKACGMDVREDVFGVARQCPFCGDLHPKSPGKKKSDPNVPATETQLSYLASEGIEHDPGLTNSQATALLREAFALKRAERLIKEEERWAEETKEEDTERLVVEHVANLATDPQKRRLRFFGLYSEGLSKRYATSLIDEWLAKHPEEEGKYQRWKARLPTDDEFGERTPRTDLMPSPKGAESEDSPRWRNLWLVLLVPMLLVTLAYVARTPSMNGWLSSASKWVADFVGTVVDFVKQAFAFALALVVVLVFLAGAGGRRKRGRGIPGLSFSWRRAVGISAAKGRISRAIGIPLTRSGRQRKIGRWFGG